MRHERVMVSVREVTVHAMLTPSPVTAFQERDPRALHKLQDLVPAHVKRGPTASTAADSQRRPAHQITGNGPL